MSNLTYAIDKGQNFIIFVNNSLSYIAEHSGLEQLSPYSSIQA